MHNLFFRYTAELWCSRRMCHFLLCFNSVKIADETIPSECVKQKYSGIGHVCSSFNSRLYGCYYFLDTNRYVVSAGLIYFDRHQNNVKSFAQRKHNMSIHHTETWSVEEHETSPEESGKSTSDIYH